MSSNDILTLARPPGHMLEVKCRARFPKEHIINFALASAGRFTLTLGSGREILRADARLHDATYKHLVINGPQILEAFAEGRDAKRYLSFPPLTKFRLDPFDEPGSDDSDASWPDTARLVDVTNLPAMVAYGRRPIGSLEPRKGVVNARLEAMWGKDVGHPISKHKRTDVGSVPLADTIPVRRPVHTRASSSPGAAAGSSDKHLTLPLSFPEHPTLSEPEFTTELGSCSPIDATNASTSKLSPSVPETRCWDFAKCTTWPYSDTHGLDVRNVLAEINARLPEDAQPEYLRMLNLELCSDTTKDVCHGELLRFAAYHDIVELHDRLLALQGQVEKRDCRRLLSDSEAEGSVGKSPTRADSFSQSQSLTTEPGSGGEAFALATLEGLAAASNALREVCEQGGSVRDAQSEQANQTLSDNQGGIVSYQKSDREPPDAVEKHGRGAAAAARIGEQNSGISDGNIEIAVGHRIERGIVLRSNGDIQLCPPVGQQSSNPSNRIDRERTLAQTRSSLKTFDKETSLLAPSSATNELTTQSVSVKAGYHNTPAIRNSLQAVPREVEVTDSAESSIFSSLENMAKSDIKATPPSRIMVSQEHHTAPSNIGSGKSFRKGPKMF